MLVSVITICFNSEAVIRKTIESVLAQSWPEVEYLIIDGASKDNTVAIAREYESAFAEKGYSYHIFSEPDKGIYDAMNKGIKKSTGEIIGLINSGDWYEPIAVQTAAEAYQKDAYELFYADINLIKADGSLMVKHSRYDRFPTSRHWNHPTMFVPRKTYDELGLYRCEGIHDDFEFFVQAKKLRSPLRRSPISSPAVPATPNLLPSAKPAAWTDTVTTASTAIRGFLFLSVLASKRQSLSFHNS